MAVSATSEVMTPERGDSSHEVSTSWASGILLLTAAVGVLARIAGVLVLPGMKGNAPQRSVELVEVASWTLSYMYVGLLVAVVCGGSFELSRARRVGTLARGAIVAGSGLAVALASPAVMLRLPAPAAVALAVTTSLLVGGAGVVTSRVPHTRAVGAILVLLALTGLCRSLAWQTATLAGERASLAMYDGARAVATAAVTFQAAAAMLAAAWIGTRSPWRGRVLANVAVIGAFAITYWAARADAHQSSAQGVLRATLSNAAGVPLPFVLAPIASFLAPASALLAASALAQRVTQPATLAAVALALLSNGSYDVPLQALAAIAASQWAVLAMADRHGMWASLSAGRRAP
ncbi:MAG: hypothetical protein KC657_24400 [Myxococcales bacterium]|nr:hypothetical protein [Myxococcales bacterium]